MLDLRSSLAVLSSRPPPASANATLLPHELWSIISISMEGFNEAICKAFIFVPSEVYLNDFICEMRTAVVVAPLLFALSAALYMQVTVKKAGEAAFETEIQQFTFNVDPVEVESKPVTTYQ
jgi:hypothetical protein